MKWILFIALIFFVSCGQELGRDQSRRSGSSTNFSALSCSCPDFQDPVCAFDGSRYITFLNDCIAQCNGFEYTKGACSPNLGTTCNSSSGQVCGRPACPTQTNCDPPGLYGNECLLQEAGATPLDMSQCIN